MIRMDERGLDVKQSIRVELEALAEGEYGKFSQGLIPGKENIIGIRLPILRERARGYAKEEWESLLEEDDLYFEETMLRGMILGYAIKDPKKLASYVEAFIPLVDNWSVCDSVFMGMSTWQKDRAFTWEFIQKYLYSEKEFEVRVALIIMMQHLLKCDEKGKKIPRLRNVSLSQLSDKKEVAGLYVERVLMAIDRSFMQGYYASMAASWLLAECFCCFPFHTHEFIKENKMDNVTYNKGIQKIIESKIPTDEVKDYLRGLKRS